VITNRHLTLETELLRWMLLVVAALATVLMIATALAAAEPTRQSRLIPGEIGHVASLPARRVFAEALPSRDVPPAEAAAHLWMTLRNLQAGCTAEAMAGWEQLRLPEGTAHWREIAVAAALLQAGDLEQAAQHLDVARELSPDHALVAYYTGILRMEQAGAEARLPAGHGEDNVRLVAYTPLQDKAVYDMLAATELEMAIARAGEIRLDQPLLTLEPGEQEAVVIPRVGDLLVALGADNFVGKAHHLLFGICLDRGELATAERHLDEAAATGIATLHGYQDLGETYLALHRPADALRAARKDVRNNHPEIGETWNRLNEATYQSVKGMWVW
jgi:tetratricopeptide (TPR) repeat protein